MVKGSLVLVKKEQNNESSKLFTWANTDIFLNNLNHGLIAITTFYLSWMCLIKSRASYHISVHTIVATLGYQLFMAEGILAFYKRNTYTILVESREKKTKIHWIFLTIGSILAVVGTFYEYVWREQNNREHAWVYRHSLWGMASMFLLIPTILAGLASLFPRPLRRFLKPLLSKWTHNVFGVAAFVTGMVSTIMGYTDLGWTRQFDPGHMSIIMAWCLSFVTVITLIGPAKTFCNQMKSFYSQFRSSSSA